MNSFAPNGGHHLMNAVSSEYPFLSCNNVTLKFFVIGRASLIAWKSNGHHQQQNNHNNNVSTTYALPFVKFTFHNFTSHTKTKGVSWGEVSSTVIVKLSHGLMYMKLVKIILFPE